MDRRELLVAHSVYATLRVARASRAARSARSPWLRPLAYGELHSGFAGMSLRRHARARCGGSATAASMRRNGRCATDFAFGTTEVRCTSRLPRFVAPAQAGAQFRFGPRRVEAARTSFHAEGVGARPFREASRGVSVQCQARDRSGTRPAVAIARFASDFTFN